MIFLFKLFEQSFARIRPEDHRILWETGPVLMEFQDFDKLLPKCSVPRTLAK